MWPWDCVQLSGVSPQPAGGVSPRAAGPGEPRWGGAEARLEGDRAPRVTLGCRPAGPGSQGPRTSPRCRRGCGDAQWMVFLCPPALRAGPGSWGDRALRFTLSSWGGPERALCCRAERLGQRGGESHGGHRVKVESLTVSGSWGSQGATPSEQPPRVSVSLRAFQWSWRLFRSYSFFFFFFFFWTILSFCTPGVSFQ